MINIKSENKKYLTLVCILLSMFAGASLIVYGCYRVKSTESSLDSINVGDTVMNKGKVLTFEYNKHRYINIVKMDNDGNTMSYLLHDPNCPCISRKLNNITTVITNTDNDNSSASDSINKANYRAILNALAEIRNDNKNLHNKINAVYNKVNKPKIVYRTVTRTVYKRR